MAFIHRSLLGTSVKLELTDVLKGLEKVDDRVTVIPGAIAENGKKTIGEISANLQRLQVDLLTKLTDNIKHVGDNVGKAAVDIDRANGQLSELRGKELLRLQNEILKVVSAGQQKLEEQLKQIRDRMEAVGVALSSRDYLSARKVFQIVNELEDLNNADNFSLLPPESEAQFLKRIDESVQKLPAKRQADVRDVMEDLLAGFPKSQTGAQRSDYYVKLLDVRSALLRWLNDKD